MRWFAVLLLVVVTGCRYDGAYTCERDEQCRSRAAPGTCQLPAGVCSFPDPTCPMGQRYDDTAGAVAGECVGMPAGDASGVDAPPFDPRTCPTAFTQIVPASSSRYRILSTLPATAHFPDYMALCEAQLPGKTHGAIIETAAEAMALAATVGNNGPQHYIGAVQDPAATTPQGGWIYADGAPVPAARWLAGQPDDGNTLEGQTEQAAILTNTGALDDVEGKVPIPVLCECDGKTVSPMFTAFVAGNTWN